MWRQYLRMELTLIIKQTAELSHYILVYQKIRFSIYQMIKILEISLKENTIHKLKKYSKAPSRFTISRILEIPSSNEDLKGIQFVEKAVSHVKEKDYDFIEPPLQWAEAWDLSNWVMITAHVKDQLAGGCIVAYDTKGISILEERSDLTALWDIRVSSNFQRQGIGSQLFDCAVVWSKNHNCKIMNIETQNNNVPACHFYAQKGSALKSIDRFHYPDFPDEIQLIWQKKI